MSTAIDLDDYLSRHPAITWTSPKGGHTACSCGHPLSFSYRDVEHLRHLLTAYDAEVREALAREVEDEGEEHDGRSSDFFDGLDTAALVVREPRL